MTDLTALAEVRVGAVDTERTETGEAMERFRHRNRVDCDPAGYDLDDHFEVALGRGVNRLRVGDRAAMPRALRVGDVLLTGETVLSESVEGFNGKVRIHIAHGSRSVWLDVPARLPIALSMPGDRKADDA